MRSWRVALLTWYGSSVTTIWKRPARGSSMVGAGADQHAAVAGGVGVLDVVDDRRSWVLLLVIRMPPVGKSGPLMNLQQVVDGGVGVVDQVQQGVDHLAQVVRRDVGRHADGDAGRAVADQVREAARAGPSAPGACRRSWAPVDGVLVDVGQHLHARAASAAPRCSAWRRAGRRRRSRSCPGRRPAGSAC